MREQLIQSLLTLSDDASFCFLTGDLGFAALEPLRDALGRRFINSGIAEQNMVSVAAGLARDGFRPWVYSIAPFCFARPFEQIRNDVCLHDLPVRLLGNGAGYGYGVQGPSHHALEDCAAMGGLRHMRVFAPAFAEDLTPLVTQLNVDPHPAYIRLGTDEARQGQERPPFDALRPLCDGQAGVIVALGGLAGQLWDLVLEMPPAKRPALWCCSRLPGRVADLPECLLAQIAGHPWCLVVEEHVAHGGLGSALSLLLHKAQVTPRRFLHRPALGYVSGNYGSQEFHRRECGLDRVSLAALIKELG